MPNLGTTEIIIIALVVLVLFGSKKLPDAARSFGRSLRIFKAETKGLRDDDHQAPAVQPAPLPIEAPAQVAAPAQGAQPGVAVNGSAPAADRH
ncbi:Sec-independent protein translocase subunit TatA [Candidatus Frankia alpina]|uniref:Sec-independent protein translocase subunit TatA n=1 Tax=Candidatus Frankia alpina TaxID=2699483 RepID=UPI0013D31718|nr:Sec-independent protein translocase subunit TatA [Candidatus Frankia alpina]